MLFEVALRNMEYVSTDRDIPWSNNLDNVPSTLYFSRGETLAITKLLEKSIVSHWKTVLY